MTIRGDQWTENERKSLQMKVSPIITFDDMKRADDILSDGNIYWTGEEIRDQLFAAGFRVVKINA